MDIAVASYITFTLRDGTAINGQSYQNFFPGETRTYGGTAYKFAPFVLSGNRSSRGGETGQSSLITTPNPLTVNLIAEAATNHWLVDVQTVILDTPEDASISESYTISTEIWSCVSGSHDYEKVTLILSSPLDATREQVPKRVLSQYLVGSLPPTGTIFTA
jgi:hypothetical protein